MLKWLLRAKSLALPDPRVPHGAYFTLENGDLIGPFDFRQSNGVYLCGAGAAGSTIKCVYSPVERWMVGQPAGILEYSKLAPVPLFSSTTTTSAALSSNAPVVIIRFPSLYPCLGGLASGATYRLVGKQPLYTVALATTGTFGPLPL